MMLPTIKDATDRLRFLNLRRRQAKLNKGATKQKQNFLYVCMVNTIYLLSFVETPRKFIIAELSIRKLGSSSVL